MEYSSYDMIRVVLEVRLPCIAYASTYPLFSWWQIRADIVLSRSPHRKCSFSATT